MYSLGWFGSFMTNILCLCPIAFKFIFHNSLFGFRVDLSSFRDCVSFIRWVSWKNKSANWASFQKSFFSICFKSSGPSIWLWIKNVTLEHVIYICDILILKVILPVSKIESLFSIIGTKVSYFQILHSHSCVRNTIRMEGIYAKANKKEKVGFFMRSWMKFEAKSYKAMSYKGKFH